MSDNLAEDSERWDRARLPWRGSAAARRWRLPDKQFQNEVGNLMAVRHDNIVKLVGFFFFFLLLLRIHENGKPSEPYFWYDDTALLFILFSCVIETSCVVALYMFLPIYFSFFSFLLPFGFPSWWGPDPWGLAAVAVGPFPPLVAGDRSMWQCVTGVRRLCCVRGCNPHHVATNGSLSRRADSRGSSRVTVALKAVCLQQQVRPKRQKKKTLWYGVVRCRSIRLRMITS
jgi:hypothetical protein